MRILQMIDIPWDSGLAHYALVVSQGLQEKGHEIFVSAIPDQKPWAKAKRLGLSTVSYSTLKGLRGLRRFVHDHHIELINAHTGSTHSLAVAAAFGQPVAVVRTRSDARAIRRRVGSTFLFNHTQRVIAAADYIRDAFVDTLKLAPRKVLTVYQGVAVPEGDIPAFPAQPVIGIVARLDPVKGHRYLLEALSVLRASYPQARLRLIGQEENVKTSELRGMAERLRIDGMISFEGYQADVARIMKACTIGVVPSTGSEAVSRVALEWMAAGRPVVATKVGCLPELIDDGKTGLLVEPKSAPALARAIGETLRSPSKIQTMGEAGRRRAAEKFSLAGFVTATAQAYEGAIAEPRGRR